MVAGHSFNQPYNLYLRTAKIDIQYQVLLNILDNYCPMVLSVYSIIFKLNDFAMYLKTISKLWVMFVCFKRRHYNKSPLVWLSNYLYWTKNCPQLASLMQQFITSFDEYPVEHTHSVVRKVTNIADEPNVVIRKIKNVFANKQSQANFQETFGHIKITPSERTN